MSSKFTKCEATTERYTRLWRLDILRLVWMHKIIQSTKTSEYTTCNPYYYNITYYIKKRIHFFPGKGNKNIKTS